MLWEDYTGYANALDKFAKKAVKDPKHSNWFVEYKQTGVETRSTKNKYVAPLHRWIDTQRALYLT